MSEITHAALLVRATTCEVMFRGRMTEPIGNQTIWWSQTGSNRRPHACKARALPAELWPRNQKTNAPHSIKMVGLGRLELPTSRLSSARSNQLSYKPLTRGTWICSQPATPDASHSAVAPARVRPRRKRNEDGEIPPVELNEIWRSCWPLMFLKRFDSERELSEEPSLERR